MRRKIIFFLLFASIHSPALASDECPAIQDDDARLSCYDLSDGGRAKTVQQAGETWKWRVQPDTSVMTDETTIVAALNSENDIEARFGNGTGPASMLLRCQENTTSAYFTFNDHFMSSIQGYGVVEVRLDKGSVSKLRAQESTDNMSLGLWSGGKSIPFIKSLYGHETMVLRATPFNESSVTLTFDIRGVEQATAELRETCGW